MIRRPPRSTRLTHSFPTRRSSDLGQIAAEALQHHLGGVLLDAVLVGPLAGLQGALDVDLGALAQIRSEEHTSELQSLMRISYAVFCLKKKKKKIEEH